MKLRFHSNTLRLRLSRTDVAELLRAGSVEESVTFAPGTRLIYRLESAQQPSNLSAAFDGSRIAVSVPRALASRWAETDLVAIEGSSGPLNILIEKDFQCAHRDAPEDAEAFPNPAAKGVVTPRRD